MQRRNSGEPSLDLLRAFVAVLAVVAITVVELVALSNGIDGTALGISFAALGSIGGWFGRELFKR